MSARIATIIFAVLLAHAPSVSADTSIPDGPVTITAALQQLDYPDARYRVRPQVFIPQALPDHAGSLARR